MFKPNIINTSTITVTTKMRERERERESEPIVRSKFNYLFCTHLHKQKSLYIAAMINDYPQSPTSNHQKKNVTGST